MAKKIPEVTKEEIKQCNDFNQRIIKEYIENGAELAVETKKQYKSGLQIWIRYIKDYLNNKPIYEIKAKEFMRYQNWLLNYDLGESAVRIKRSCISTLNSYIMFAYEDEYPTFRNFVTKQVKIPQLGDVYEKVPLTPDEYRNLCTELERRKEWEKIAYLKFTYFTACRRAESIQLLKEVVNYKPVTKKVKVKDEDGNVQEMEVSTYFTHKIRCKGKSKAGEIRRLQFNQETTDAIKKWLEIRGDDDCPYVFARKGKNGIYVQRSKTGFNYWCSHLFTEIVGRRVHPHLFRESRATNLVVHSGKDLETAQKLLGHKSSDTTKIYVIRDDENDASDAFI